MAILLHMAQTNNGRVLSTLPIHKAGSLGEEAADLRRIQPLLILKTTQLLPSFGAIISHRKPIHRAQSYPYGSVDRGEATWGKRFGGRAVICR